ncbi:MAG: M23 family metallopeptidase, partial [Deltaproteobacteria bacterium]
MKRAFVSLAVLAFVCAAPVAGAQVRHRRPLVPAPTLSYHFDDNGTSAGCQDYNCGTRCYDAHTGTDMPVPIGTAALASADGTVAAINNGCATVGFLGNTCGGRCGNYVQLRHADGTRSTYCHMQLDSIMVTLGQRVRCGQTLGRSGSSGSSTGPHLHFGWKRTSTAASTDPFRGSCSSSTSQWTLQRAYPASPGDQCQCVPAAETCNNLDDDCDGQIDDGVSRGCYAGPPGTDGRGICVRGTQPCSAGTWGACGGEVLPREEICNGLDDNCDGNVDEGVCSIDAGSVTDAAADGMSARDANVDGARRLPDGAVSPGRMVGGCGCRTT